MGGCAKSNAPEKIDIIAYVNKEPVYESDLRKEIFVRGQDDPNFRYTQEVRKEQLDIMINKKIVMQEAMKKGLANTERFTSTMKAFWEQTLVKYFVDMKKKELQAQITISQDEIKKYYDKLSEKVTFKVLKSTNLTYIQDLYSKFIALGQTVSIPFDTIGPVGYDEIGSGILSNAFDLPAGGAKIYSDPPDNYFIVMEKREARNVEPFEKAGPDIKKRLMAMKESDMFEAWLKEKRKRSEINILK